MIIEINKQEAYKILDAIKAYTTNYSVTGSVNKTFDNITVKIKRILDENNS